MYGISTLKDRRHVNGTVPCPVKGCAHTVPAQPGILRLTPEFKCPVHKLYLSETVYAYEKETDGLLWTDRDGLALLRASRGERPAPSLGLETSEDALLWNVFRWCETAGVLPGLLERWTGHSGYEGRLLYWGWDDERERVWDPLRRARYAFEEDEDGTMEPGLVIESPGEVFLLAARGFSPGPARREPTTKSPALWARYEAASQGWARRVLARSCCDLVSDSGAYELLRSWLLGTWIAAGLQKNFVLVSVAPVAWADGVLERVLPRLRGGQGSLVVQATWEDLYAHVLDLYSRAPGAPALLTYLSEKSAGYGRDGQLRRAFSVQGVESSDVDAAVA